MAGLGQSPADFAKKFEGHLRTPAGQRLSEVVVDISLSGIRLEGPSGPLGSFTFTKILQWETGLSDYFSFTVRTENGGEQEIQIYSSSANVTGIQAAVEEKVARIMELKRRGFQVGDIKSPEVPVQVVPDATKHLPPGGAGFPGPAAAGMRPPAGPMQPPGFGQRVGNMFRRPSAFPGRPPLPGAGPGMNGGMGMMQPGMNGMGMPGGYGQQPAAYGLQPQQQPFNGLNVAQPAPALTPPPQPTPSMAPAPAPAAAPTPAPAPAPAPAPTPAPAPAPPPKPALPPGPPPAPPKPKDPPPSLDRKLSSTAAQARDGEAAEPGTPAGEGEAAKKARAGRGGAGRLEAKQLRSAKSKRRKARNAGRSPTKQLDYEISQRSTDLEKMLSETREYAQRMKAAVAKRDSQIAQLQKKENALQGEMLESIRAKEEQMRDLKKDIGAMMPKFAEGYGAARDAAEINALLTPRKPGPTAYAGNGVSALHAENNALKAQIGRLKDRASASQGHQEEAAELRVANSRLRQHNNELTSQPKFGEGNVLNEKLRGALHATEEEVVQLQGKVGRLEEELAQCRLDLSSQERALENYEATMAQNLASPLMGSPMMTPGAFDPDAGPGQEPVSQLRTLMGEAYLLKMAIKKQAKGNNEELLGALDTWIMASHRLKKNLT